MLVPDGSTAPEALPQTARCWCGNGELAPFSAEYRLCTRCSTVVLAAPPKDPSHVADEATSLYGINYFYQHASQLGHPSLPERARNDLPERCVFWLDALLRFRPPPARTLELGCANGAFVGLLAEAGYEATGLDLSPEVTRFVHEIFQVPVLTGPLEEQRLAPGSIDVVIMMDVLEHLPDPVGTLRAAARILAPDGILLVQTPRFEPSKSYQALEAANDPFLDQLKSSEHLFLLSRSSAARLLGEAGFGVIEFIPAIFSEYDMSFVASRAPLHEAPEESRREALRRTRSGRIAEALLDAGKRNLNEIPAIRRQLAETEAARAQQLAESEAARAKQLAESEVARATLLRRVNDLTSEVDRLLAAEAQLRVRLAEQENRVQDEQKHLALLQHRMDESEAAGTGLRNRLDEMAAQLLVLRAVEQNHRQVVRRLGFLARIFGARRFET